MHSGPNHFPQTGEALYPLIQPLLAELKKHPEGCVLAIDGMCGAGKSSLSELLCGLCPCSLVRADDFLLPPRLRTPERLSEPGGNIHYERFLSEVVTPLLAKKQAGCLFPCQGAAAQIPFKGCGGQRQGSGSGEPLLFYRRFSCHTMDYCPEPVAVYPAPLLIIEGSYCMRREFRPLYDLSVFLKCSPETQKRRILERNGAEMLDQFTAKWIPMENRYFAAQQVEEACSLSIATG